MRPPIQYFGAKQQIAEQIVELMPAHIGYIEPYCGSLAVLLAKPESVIEVMNDLDHRLMTFWRVLRNHPHELLRLCELTPHSRAELEAASRLDADTDLELARQVWVMLTQGRSRTMKRTGWRFYADTANTNASMATYMEAYRKRLLPAAERLQTVSLECRPALDVIRQYGAFEDNLLYVDPPYVTATRSPGRYSHEMTDDDHRELAAALHECDAAVLLSGYPSDLYGELYADWRCMSMRVASTKSVEKEAVEALWSNREFGALLWDEHELREAVES
jgi:DNA adenine methylase